MFWVDKCLDAILWVMEMKLHKMLVKMKLVLYGNTRSHELNRNMENHQENSATTVHMALA
jgi:hypothetical protein